jgi:probable HAF family extracellular repeat protein
MWFTTLLGCLSGKVAYNQEPRTNRRSVPLRHRKRCARSRPRLEGLEDRTVPSGSYVFTTIDDPNGTFFSVAGGINSRGDIVGEYAGNDFFNHGFLLSGGQYSNIDDPDGVNGTFASGINASGQIVGSYSDANFVSHVFLLRGGQYTTLIVPNGIDPSPTGINDHGQVVGQYADASGNLHGFLLSGGQFTNIDDPNGVGGSVAYGINSRGDIVGAFVDASFSLHGFLLSGGQYTTFDVPNGIGNTLPLGINDHGQIVGDYTDTNTFATRGFLLSGGQYTNLDDPNAGGPGSGATFAQGISDSGKIVGAYIDANGLFHAFLATPSQQSPVGSAPSPGVHPSNAGFLDRTLQLKTASLDHARVLRIQVNSGVGEFGMATGQALGRTVPGPTTSIVTVATRNGDAAGLMGQGSGTRIVSAAAARSQDLNVFAYDVFDRNDSPFDLGLLLQGN